jgi:uncharacterized membrane protein
MYSKIKIFGHPGFAIYGATSDLFWLKATIAVNLAGIVMAALAAVPGFLDWLLGIPRETGAKKEGLVHGLFNVAALGLFIASFATYASHWNGPATGAAAGIVLSALGVACTLAAGWYGWMLVQTWHVGVSLEGTQVQADSTLQEYRARKAG